MVVFTCTHCGESLQKPRVEKHYQTTCRNSISVTCMDCFKDFKLQEYVGHTKCITEEQRYSAKGSVQGGAKKGEMKQISWVAQINNIIATQENLKPNERSILELISKNENVPRKKAKFINFMKSTSGGRVNQTDIEAVWDILEAEKIKEKEKQSNDAGNKTGNETDKKTKKNKRKADSEENAEDAKKIKQDEKVEGDEDKTSKKKKRKSSETESKTEETTENVPQTKKQKKGKNVENSEIEETTQMNGKGKKKNKKNQQNTEVKKEETTEVKENIVNVNKDGQGKKKKNKKNKQNNKNTEDIKEETEVVAEVKVNTENSKKKNKKNQQQNGAPTTEGESTEAKPDETPTSPKKKNKKNKKAKALQNGGNATQNGSPTKSADTSADLNSSNADSFSWAGLITDVVKSHTSIAKDDLQTAVLKKFQDIKGSEPTVKHIKNFQRKLKKIPNIKVENDVYSLT